MNTPVKYEVWTKNDISYIMADGQAVAWSDNYDQIKALCDRMAGKYLPMIPEFRTFLPVVQRQQILI